MLKAEKQTCITELEGVFNASSSVIFTHYHGLTVADVTKLRKSLKASGSSFKVVKNTLSKIAAGKASVSAQDTFFAGPTGIAFSEDPIAAAKVVVEFAKTNDKLKVVGGIVDNKVVSLAEVQRLAELPSMDALRAQIIGVLQAPASKLVRTVGAPAAQLARLCRAYADKA